MLKIYFREMKNSIYNTKVYFKNTYEEEWITSPMAKEIIKNIMEGMMIINKCTQGTVYGTFNMLMGKVYEK